MAPLNHASIAVMTMSDPTDPYSWPKTVEVSGREYTIHPDMSMMEMKEVMDSLAQEAAKLTALKYAAGYELDEDEKQLLDVDEEDTNR